MKHEIQSNNHKSITNINTEGNREKMRSERERDREDGFREAEKVQTGKMEKMVI